MRLIGTLPTETDARRLSNYLLSIGLRNHVEPASNGEWMFWIEHDDHIDQAHSQLNAYRTFPTDPKYDAATANAETIRKQEEAAAKRRRERHVDVRTSWSGARIRPTPVTFIIVGICVVLALITMTGTTREGPSVLSEKVTEALAFQPFSAVRALLESGRVDINSRGGEPMLMFSSIFQGQVWRLVTPAFLHGNIGHILFNMLWVMLIARLIEARKGSLFLVGLVIGSAIFSNVIEALWTVYRPNSNGWVMFLGFSGVNYALFGYAWMKGKYQAYDGIGVSQQIIGAQLAWLVLCMTGLVGNIANGAHIGGLIFGMIVGYWPTWRRTMKPRLTLRP